ncbi:hypothetical protein FLL45_19850 [Aliikangiella marina]|uniref:Uncharacterized protein n=1 Tax=Aliikangiella marina TaxID=1712262 RepID=A0A545T2H3_9GAMM|nr:hypothetical protein [Aliikangiella marina]TQV71412.1 hypothetical protein FLL45_19850 [Aliikangiella marina]
MKTFWNYLKSFKNLHVDLSTILILLLIVVLIWPTLLNGILGGFEYLNSDYILPESLKNTFLGVIANLITAAIVVPTIFYFFNLKRKTHLCGEFKAFDIEDGNEKY